ncbi:MAG: cohesin domain-containing protein [Oscillospiraceae bacterium]|nr:cohesin domain-containing protein [Oscillospiraceae bacterium]
MLIGEINGDEFYATISLADNPGIAGFRFDLLYNNTKLEQISVEEGDVIATPGAFLFSTIPGMVRAQWTHAFNVTNSGPLVVVRFRILPEAYGTTTLNIVQRATSFVNANLELVPVEVTNGILEIDNTQSLEIIITENNLISHWGAISGSVHFDILNNRSDVSSAVMILAIYDAGDRLIYINFLEIGNLLGGYHSASFQNIQASVGAGFHRVRIFCWDSLIRMRPLTNGVTFRI